jgi:short-subunit dehydrogenase
VEDYQKYAFIPGASFDIGWHFAEALAKYGYSEFAASNQPA